MVALPPLPPLQPTFVIDTILSLIGTGCVSVTDAVLVQPFKSVTVTV